MAKTYREIVYIIQDEMKILSDDSLFETDHFVFMANKYRALLFKQYYKGKKVEIPFAWYQRLSVDFKLDYGDKIYQSKTKLPEILDLSNIWQYTFVNKDGAKSNNFNFVNPHRFKYVTKNKWLVNQSYVTIDLDNKMYVKNFNNQEDSLLLNYDTILDNPIEGYRFNGDESLDVLDFIFPCEESLIQPIIDLCLKEIGVITRLPGDVVNNATDDLNILTQQQQQQTQ